MNKMYTVQYYLEIVDSTKLINTYYELVKDEIFIDKNKDITINDFELYYKNKIWYFIQSLIEMKIKKTKEKGIIFAYKMYEENISYPNINTSLIYKHDLIKNKLNVESYAYEFLPQSEIIGFYISNNTLTQDNIFEVLSQILYEASFFGFEEETKQQAKIQLNNAIKEINLNGTDSFIKWDDVKKKFNIEEDKDTKEIELKHNVLNMVMKINKYLYEKELKEMITYLDNEEK